MHAVHIGSCSWPARSYRAPLPILYDVSCSEQSRYLAQDCNYSVSQSPAECDSVLYIRCFPLANCTEGAIRLVDRRSPLEGRIEICVSGLWGVLPRVYGDSGSFSYGFSLAAFEMAENKCKQLGLPWECKLLCMGCVLCVHACVYMYSYIIFKQESFL